MSKVIAVFGAGTGLGLSVARRFGREGHRVALVARRKDRLDALVEQLSTEGIEAEAFPADLGDPDQAPGLVEAVRARFGRIDVVEYGPVDANLSFTAATALDAAALQRLIPLLLLTPVEIFHAVVPEMIERGDGAILMTTGVSAVHPMAGLGGPGVVMAAARNHVHTLNAELTGQGVYVGTLSVAAAIARSKVLENASTGSHTFDPTAFPVVDPDDLADVYWDMYTRRDQVERIHPTW
ncbi:SDR family NAD(P)-dependent oxidoreductase [Herbidospora sp. RD11066]